MQQNKPNYYGIIPANVRYDKRLTPNAKLLYSEITALCNEKGFCWATNKYFSELYEVSTTSISKWISSLIEFGYLKSSIKYKEGSKEILNRYLTLLTYPIEEKLNTPIEEKLKDNSTTLNIKYNNKEEKEKDKFSPPTILEVISYFKEKGYMEITAKKAFDYYDVANWKDSKGNQVKNWKQKMISVWMKPENKINELINQPKRKKL